MIIQMLNNDQETKDLVIFEQTVLGKLPVCYYYLAVPYRPEAFCGEHLCSQKRWTTYTFVQQHNYVYNGYDQRKEVSDPYDNKREFR